MSEGVERVGKPNQVGIKHPGFRPKSADGTSNGHSHRKNAAAKKAQYLRNQKTRGDLYREHQGRGNSSAAEWHSRLAALSAGTA